MRLTIIPSDKRVIVDGKGRKFDFSMNDNYHAVQWEGASGFIETKVGLNIKIQSLDDFPDILSILDQYNQIIAKEDADRAAYEASPQKALDDVINARRASYPPIGDQLDALWKHIDAERNAGKVIVKEANDILDQIMAVKAAHAKPNGGI